MLGVQISHRNKMRAIDFVDKRETKEKKGMMSGYDKVFVRSVLKYFCVNITSQTYP